MAQNVYKRWKFDSIYCIWYSLGRLLKGADMRNWAIWGGAVFVSLLAGLHVQRVAAAVLAFMVCAFLILLAWVWRDEVGPVKKPGAGPL